MTNHDIAAVQNQESSLNLLKASTVTYGKLQAVNKRRHMFILTVFALGLVLLLVNFFLAGPLTSMGLPWLTEGRLKVAIGVLGGILVFVDILYFEKQKKHFAEQGAKLQEHFDCAVLNLPWNAFQCGAKLDDHSINKLSAQFRKKISSYQDWYNVPTQPLPLHIAQYLCQHQNLTWDAELRLKWISRLKSITFVLALVLLGLALLRNAGILDMVLILVSLATPIRYIVKEILDNQATVGELEKLRDHMRDLWAKHMTTKPHADPRSARQVQDQIFLHRKNCPKIPDAFAKRHKADLESFTKEKLHERAEEYLAQAPAGP